MNIDKFIKKADLGNYEISINAIKPGNPLEMLEKLYPIKDDNTLTNKEKMEQVQRVINDYME